MERVIFHCDLNSFYASVELLDHPELRHLPVAVCGDPNSRHGIILPSFLASRPLKPSGRPEKNAPNWSFFPPTMTDTVSYPGRSTGYIRTTPTW